MIVRRINLFILLFALAAILPSEMAGEIELYEKGARIIDFTPEDPEILGFSDFNPTYGYGTVRFRIPTVNIYGAQLPTENISYRMIVDGKPYIYYARSNPFPNGEMKAEWIPWNYSDYDLKIEGDDRYLFYFFEGGHNLAFQSRYIETSNAKEWLSGIVDNGVEKVSETISEESTAIEEWYDLQGKPVSISSRGPYIRVLRYSDGRIKTSKVNTK